MNMLSDAERCKLYKNLKRKLKPSSGWLCNNFLNIYEKEIFVEGDFIKVVKAFTDFLGSEKIKNVIVFPEYEWSQYETLYNNSPVIMNLSETKKFFETFLTNTGGETIIAEINNYYITDTSLNFEWIFTICHEEDFHLSGDQLFIKKAKNYFYEFPMHKNKDASKVI